MKHLQSFFENSSDEFNLELKIAKIKEKYSPEDVEKMFDEEWPNWVDDSWEDDSSIGSDWDWYLENCDNVAQSVVLDMIIDDDDLSDDIREKLEKELIKIYPILSPL